MKVLKTPLPSPKPQNGRVIPQEPNIEASVLGALLLEAKAMSNVVEILSVDCFYTPANRTIYGVLLSMHNENSAIDINTVVVELRKKGSLAKVGGVPYLAQLTHNIASAAHLESHARLLVEYAVRRRAISVFQSSIEKAFDEGVDIFDLLDSAEKNLFDATDNIIAGECEDVSQVLQNTISKIEKTKTSKDGVVGIPSGFSALDAITHGWQAPGFYVIAGRPGMGKTSFLISLLRHAAVVAGKRVGIFSLEMDNEQIARRLISQETGISTEVLSTGKMNEKHWANIYGKTASINEASIYFDCTPSLTIFDLRAKCRRLKSRHEIDMVIVDYLQLMAGDRKGGFQRNREQEIAEISRGLKSIAKELGIPIIVASQLSRAVETRGGDKRPQLSDLRESGAIEQDVDMAMFLYRPEYYDISQDDAGEPTEGIAEVIIAKNRNGRTGRVRLRFDANLTKFSNREAHCDDFVYSKQKIKPVPF